MRDDRSQDHLDALIDDVARSITEGAPAASLRAAVRARIGDPQQWTVRVWRVGIAAAAVAIALIAGRAMFGTDNELSSSPPSTLAERKMATEPSARRSETASIAAPDSTAAGPRRATTDRVVMLRPPAPVVVAPINVPHLEEPPLHVEVIEVPMPLRAERLEIDPLVFR